MKQFLLKKTLFFFSLFSYEEAPNVLAVFLWDAKGILFFCFAFTVQAAVNAFFSVCQLKDMVDFLFHCGDTAGIFAENDVCDLFGQFRMEFLHLFAVLNDADCHVGVHVAQYAQIHVQHAVDLDDVFLAHFLAVYIAQDGNGAVQFIQMQEMIQFHAFASFDMVNDNAVLDFVDMHYTSTPSNFRISAIRIYLPLCACLK